MESVTKTLWGQCWGTENVMKLYEFIQDEVQNRRNNHSSIFDPSTLFQPCQVFHTSREVLKLCSSLLLRHTSCLSDLPSWDLISLWVGCMYMWVTSHRPWSKALKFMAMALAGRLCRKRRSGRSPSGKHGQDPLAYSALAHLSNNVGRTRQDHLPIWPTFCAGKVEGRHHINSRSIFAVAKSHPMISISASQKGC